jgi:hypothetical protein
VPDTWRQQVLAGGVLQAVSVDTPQQAATCSTRHTGSDRDGGWKAPGAPVLVMPGLVRGAPGSASGTQSGPEPLCQSYEKADPQRGPAFSDAVRLLRNRP